MNRTLLGIQLVLIACLIPVSLAHAHKVTIFAWIEGETVHTESKFSGGKRVQGGKVEIFDSSGALMLDGRTDSNGVFSFKAPRITDMNIVLTAGMGHKNSWRLSADELGERGLVPSLAPPERPQPAVPDRPEGAPRPLPGPGISAHEIEEIFSRQLERKLQPLTRMVAASQDKGPTIRDIIGGIGYIIGLVGLGAYIRYRRDGKKS